MAKAIPASNSQSFSLPYVCAPAHRGPGVPRTRASGNACAHGQRHPPIGQERAFPGLARQAAGATAEHRDRREGVPGN